MSGELMSDGLLSSGMMACELMSSGLIPGGLMSGGLMSNWHFPSGLLSAGLTLHHYSFFFFFFLNFIYNILHFITFILTKHTCSIHNERHKPLWSLYLISDGEVGPSGQQRLGKLRFVQLNCQMQSGITIL